MAHFVMTDAVVIVGGTDLSADVESLTLNVPVEMIDDTTMGASGRERVPSFSSWTATITFKADFANGAASELLWNARKVSTAYEFRPTSAVVGVNNPKFTGSGYIPNFSPLAGNVGDQAKHSVNIEGNGALVRAEA